MRTIENVNLKYRTVILRCDLNVSIKDGKIIDDTKIKSSLKTINYILDQKAKLVIMSHLGKIKTEEDKKKNDMRIVYKRLKELLPNQVKFINETSGRRLKKAVRDLKYGEALLIQNTRYEDLKKNKESSCNRRLSKYWASLGDIFINDAFGTIHRRHASNYGISSYLPSAVGFLVQNELKNLNRLDNPKRPFVVIMGGSKVSDKIGVIESLLNKVDTLLIGGGMAYTFFKALGYNVGNSICEEDKINLAMELMEKAKEKGVKFILPVDNKIGKEFKADTESKIVSSDAIPDGWEGLDIGPETIKLYAEELKNAKTIVWNGPLGVFEFENFAVGTNEIAKVLGDINAVKIIGGGDSASAVEKAGVAEKMTHISTGGGASLEFLEGKKLPGIEALEDAKK